MVDRLEELLAQMEAEEDDDGREDVLTLTKAAVPAAPAEGDEGEDVSAPVPAPDGAGAGDPKRRNTEAGRGPDGPGWEALEDFAQDQASENEPDGTPVRLMGDNPVWAAEAAAQRQMTEALGQAAQALKTAAEAAESPAAGWDAGDGWESIVEPGGQEGGSGLELLYRQTVQAARPAAPALSAGLAGRTVRVEEPGSAASLAVDELDRAVRRDSRRYDGGMKIF